MAVTKTLNIDGIDVTFRASAAVPRIYRNKFGRDIYRDLNQLSSAVENNDEEASTLDSVNLELFEGLAWTMAWHASPDTVPESIEEWLDQFNTFSIYFILPELIDLWGLNTKQDVTAKKKPKRTEREMTTPLFLLRCVQLGISIRDLDLLTIGTVMDMVSENSNDSYDYPVVATQSDFDRF